MAHPLTWRIKIEQQSKSFDQRIVHCASKPLQLRKQLCLGLAKSKRRKSALVIGPRDRGLDKDHV